eukprot:scaffold5861_cov23-Cyclotella_meneghiniana.AAC.1
MAISSAAAAAFLSTGLISLAPNVLLFLFPNYAASSSSSHNKRSGTFLSLGQAVAVGGLMGDVFLHTLPDCFADAIHGNDGASGEDVGLRVLMGFGVFLILDVIVRSFEGGEGHSHNHHSCDSAKKKSSNKAKTNNVTPKSQWRLLCSSAVLLNLIGDALHNFTDGLAIGASFAASDNMETSSSSSKLLDNTSSSLMAWISSSFTLLKSRGGLASISVLLHEIPHELGDFATLVNAGMSRNMAIGMQFVTAIAAMIGTAVGLFSSQIIDGLGHDVLLPFTAGGELDRDFVDSSYIPLVKLKFSTSLMTRIIYRIRLPGMRNNPSRDFRDRRVRLWE